MWYIVTRATITTIANTAVDALPTSTRTKCRSATGQRIRQRGHVDPRADRRIRRIGDAGGSQDQPELQIEPWRSDLRADRSRD